MTVWEKLVDWFERVAGPWQPPPAAERPEYDRPYVRRTSQAEDERAEEAVKVLEAYVRAQTSRWRDGPK